MIKSILYVEDGSVDIDTLQEELGNEILIIPYRQGATPPVLIEPEKPILTAKEDSYNKQCKLIEDTRNCLYEAMSMKMSKKLRRTIDDILTELRVEDNDVRP